MITFSSLQKFTDSHGGLRIMTSAFTKGFRFLGGHSYVQETIIDAVERGFKVKEIPSKWNKRHYGLSRVVNSQVRYAKKMLIPLLIRMKLHLICGVGSLILLPFFPNSFFISVVLICGFVEVYKRGKFKKNRKFIERTLLD